MLCLGASIKAKRWQLRQIRRQVGRNDSHSVQIQLKVKNKNGLIINVQKLDKKLYQYSQIYIKEVIALIWSSSNVVLLKQDTLFQKDIWHWIICFEITNICGQLKGILQCFLIWNSNEDRNTAYINFKWRPCQLKVTDQDYNVITSMWNEDGRCCVSKNS